MATVIAPKKDKSKNYSVKQTFFTSMEMEKRIAKYVKDKGVKAPFIFLTATNEFLTQHGY